MIKVKNYFLYLILLLNLSMNFNLNSTDASLAELSLKLTSLASLTESEKAPQEKFEYNNTVITISDIVSYFNKATSCDANHWANKLENSCRCCLIKHAPNLNKGIKPEEILQDCINHNECNQSIISQLFTEEKVDPSNLSTLISHLFNKSIVIKEISEEDIKSAGNITFDECRNLTDASAVNFLVKAYEESKIKNPDFSSSACLTARNILKKKGACTSQLFKIVSTCSGKRNNYIFKEGTGIGEMFALKRKSLINELAPIIFPKRIHDMPSFVFPIAYIAYILNGKEHYLSLMEKAPGIPVSNFSKLYLANKIPQEVLQKTYYNIGYAMSNFHRQFMQYFKHSADPSRILNRTYIHGDAHSNNIFYDAQTDWVVFIDNEGMRAGDPFEDIIRITYIPTIIRNAENLGNAWINFAIESFFDGYIQAYPTDQRKFVVRDIISDFSEHIHSFQNLFQKLSHKYK